VALAQSKSVGGASAPFPFAFAAASCRRRIASCAMGSSKCRPSIPPVMPIMPPLMSLSPELDAPLSRNPMLPTPPVMAVAAIIQGSERQSQAI
jgi:hypothetical protein